MSLDAFIIDAHRRLESGDYDVQGKPRRPHGPLHLSERVIAEFKPASPSEGELGADMFHTLRAYRAGRPAAFSILTADGPFGGSPRLLGQAHSMGVPTMMKDFIVDDRQITYAAHHGASAVLLIERVCGPDREPFVRHAHSLGLQVVLEIDAMDQLDGAAKSAADIIGVNARDLDTLDVDPARAATILRTLRARHPDRPLLRLSGIQTPHDARSAMDDGADGVLVGTTLMRDPEPALTLQAMKGPIVKVCGMHPDDLDSAQAADMVGVVVASGSVRDVSEAKAARMLETIRRRGQTAVLVTRAAPDEAVAIAARLGPDVLQLHHACEPDVVRDALRPYGIALLPAVTRPSAPTPHLLDADAAGGSGRTLVPVPAEQSLLIAGGLDADSVTAMLSATGAQGADASSLLERSPGRKDPQKVRDFIAAVRATGRRKEPLRGLLHV